MLNIFFGRWDYTDENYIWNMNNYFDLQYEEYWINDNISKQIIKEIDSSEVIKGKAIDSPILGVISPENLSGGSKLLITINIEGSLNIYNGTKCGENCSDWLLKLSKEKDIIIDRNYPIKFSDDNFEVRILNDNSVVTNNEDLLFKFIDFKNSEYIKR